MCVLWQGLDDVQENWDVKQSPEAQNYKELCVIVVLKDRHGFFIKLCKIMGDCSTKK